MKGIFITFEGIEGVGKTTQIARLHQYLLAEGYSTIQVREPGGTEIGSHIRSILLDPTIQESFSAYTELLLYVASRAQLVHQVILPALKEGKIVLCDRFVDSTIAYQVYGAGLSIDEVLQINRLATNGLVPDRTYLFDLSPSLIEERLHLRGQGKDRMEQKAHAFHERVREGYLQLATSNSERIRVLDATKSKTEIFDEILQDFRSYS
jgi:dTMP kinase